MVVIRPRRKGSSFSRSSDPCRDSTGPWSDSIRTRARRAASRRDRENGHDRHVILGKPQADSAPWTGFAMRTAFAVPSPCLHPIGGKAHWRWRRSNLRAARAGHRPRYMSYRVRRRQSARRHRFRPGQARSISVSAGRGPDTHASARPVYCPYRGPSRESARLTGDRSRVRPFNS